MTNEIEELKSLEIDFEKGILKVNGVQVADRPVIVTLPGTDGWKRRKIFNKELSSGNKEECDLLEVECTKGTYSTTSSKPL